MENNVTSKQRLVGLDLLRIFSAFMVFLFHSGHIKCSYGPLQIFIGNGAMFMTTFFILSGFVLSFTNTGKSLNAWGDIKKFYIKRFIGLIPVYWIIAIIYTAKTLITKSDTLVNALVLFPVETIGLQSFFCSLFNVNHNGGTWFISCLIPCYLLFPFIHNILKQMPSKIRLCLMLLFMVIIVYSAAVVGFIDLDTIYFNPFFRILEFVIGCILCVEWQDGKFNKLSIKQLALTGGV